MSGKIIGIEINNLKLEGNEYRYKRYIGVLEGMIQRSLVSTQEGQMIDTLKGRMQEALEITNKIKIQKNDIFDQPTLVKLRQSLAKALATMEQINSKLKEMTSEIKARADERGSERHLSEEIREFINAPHYTHPLDSSLRLTLYEMYNELGGDSDVALKVASFNSQWHKDASYKSLKSHAALYLTMQTQVEQRLEIMEDSLAIAECLEKKLRLEGYETSRKYIDDDISNGIKIVSNKNCEVDFKLSNIVTHKPYATYHASLRISHKDCYKKAKEIQRYFLEKHFDFTITDWGELPPKDLQKRPNKGVSHGITSQSKA